jgi:UDP-GlcNAc:undecaprenyl-phosphate/decaprenyl-phosphate GlcNAc-1-phosphate transferase
VTLPKLCMTIVALAFVISTVSIPVFKRVAMRRHWLDSAGADPLKIHDRPIPFVGGFGITLGCLLSVSLAFWGTAMDWRGLALIMLLGVSIAMLGLRDDRSTVRPLMRLAVELAAGMILAVGGFALGLFDTRLIASAGMAGILLASIFIIVCVAGAINAVNMLDGMDGLAGGVALISCVGFAIVGARLDQWLALALAVALGGALAGFLVYNFHPASVFMGDNGSYFVGFMLATISLLLGFAGGTIWSFVGSVMLIGAPVFDAAFAVVRRLRRGVSPFAGDRSHFYDYLARHGLSTRAVALFSYAIQAGFVGTGAMLFLGWR